MSEQFPLYKLLQAISKWWGQNIFSAPEKKYEKVYIFFFILLIATIHLITMLWRTTLIGSWIDNLFNVTNVALFICNLSSLYCLNFSQRLSLCKLFRNINMLYKELTNQFPRFKIEEDTEFNLYFIGSHILFLLYSTFQYLTFSYLNFPVYNATPFLIFNYLVVLTVFQYCCIIFVIKNVFDYLNKKIYEFRIIKGNLSDIRNQTAISSNVKFLLKSYDKVFQIATAVNKIFGLVLLGVYLILLVNLIRSVTIIIQLGIFKWYGSEIYFLMNINSCLLWLVSLKYIFIDLLYKPIKIEQFRIYIGNYF